MHGPAGAALAIALVVPLLPAAALDGKRKVPPRVVDARTVALGYDRGDRFVGESADLADPDVRPEERRAVKAIRDEIERWGRYGVVARPGDAHLLLGVRLGVRENVGAGTGGGEFLPGPGGMRRGSSYGPDLSSGDDTLAVYECVGGRVGKRLWRARKAGGLAGEPPALFVEFRADVERTLESAKGEPARK